MQLVQQWRRIQSELPEGWDEARLTLEIEQASQLERAASVLGSANAGRVGDRLALTARARGYPGPEQLTRLFARLDRERIWATLEPTGTTAGERPAAEPPAAAEAGVAGLLAEAWEGMLATLPPDWSDLLAEVELESSDHLDRAALLCAPVNPARVRDGRTAFTFRAARLRGYGVSPEMAARCLQRLDAEAISGELRALRVLSDTNPVSTQGPVWYVGGRVL